MATLRFLLKRFAAQRLLGLAVVVTLAFSVGVLVAGPIYADAAREAILSSAVTGAAVTVANARYQVFGDGNFDWRRADASVSQAARAVPLTALIAQGLATVRIGGASGPSVPLLFRDGAGRHLAFQGTAPGPGEIALETSVPQTLGLHIGDQVAIVGPTGKRVELTLTGTFDPPRPDTFWFGDRTAFPAADSPAPPPSLVAPDTFVKAARALGLTSQYSWDAYIALHGIPYEQAVLVPGQLQSVATGLQSQPGLSNLRVTSGLDTLLRLVAQRVENLRIPILLVVFQIGAVTLAVLAGVGALTLTRQAFELSVLHSRGFTRRTLLFAQAIQASIATVVAYPIGLLIGMALARLASHSNGPTLPGVLFPVRLSGAAELLGLVAALAGDLILLLLSVPYVSRTVLEERRVVSREDRPLLARLPVELIVLPVGLFAFVQLRSDASPKPATGTIDPLVLLAPTLLLFAASFMALRLLLFSMRRLDRRIGRAKRLPVYLAGRRLARAPGTGFAAALLLLLSMGLLVVSTSYRAVVLRNHADAAHAQVGSDWNVQVAPPANLLGAIRSLPRGMTPVLRAEPQLARGTFSLPPEALAIDPVTYSTGGWWRSDFASTSLEDILARLRTPPFGQSLPNGSETLRLELDVSEAGREFTVTATTESDDGTIVTAPPQRLHPGTNAFEMSLGEARRLLSITFQTQTSIGVPPVVSVGIRSAEVDGQPIDLAGWQPITWRGSHGTLKPQASSLRYVFRPGAGDVAGGLTPSAPPLPALVSPDIAASQGADFTVNLGDQTLSVRQVAVATQFPSTVPNAPFVVLSATALLERELAIPEAGLTLNEVWSTGNPDPRPALRRDGFIPGFTRRAEPIEGFLAQLPQSLAIGMNFTAAVSGLGLVIIGVAAGLYFAQRRRDYEFAALRAMGSERRQIRRTLVLEQVVLVGFAITAGLGLGYLMLRVMMPSVGASLAASYPRPVLVFDWPVLGASLAAIVVSTALGLGLAIRGLMRSSVTGVLRGEAE